MFTKPVKIAISFFSILILFVILYFNHGLYYSPSLTTEDDVDVNEELLAELRGVREALNKGADREMQGLYPEGYLFMNSLYALAWADFIEPIKDDPDLYLQDAPNLYLESLSEKDIAYRKIDSDEGRAIFESELPLPYGAFYNGWRNYILARKLEIERVGRRKASDYEAFVNQCEAITLAIRQKETYLASYIDSTWPADEVMCVASLAIHDRIYIPRYDTIIKEWVQKIKGDLDGNGLIPHQVDARSSEIIESARGSSMSLMLAFLNDIDPTFARQQFEIYKKEFVDLRFGLPGIREYPKGTEGEGDVDSGPVIFGIGASATIVGMRVFNEYDDRPVPVAIRNGIESFGMPVNFNGRKEYLFGMLPMADAFIAWAHASDPMFEKSNSTNAWWRFLFHFYSFLFASPFIFILMRTFNFRFKKTSKK